MLNVYYAECCGDMSLTNNLVRAFDQCMLKKWKRQRPLKASTHIAFDLNMKVSTLTNFFEKCDSIFLHHLEVSMFTFAAPTAPLIPMNILNKLVVDLYYSSSCLYNLMYLQTVSVRSANLMSVSKLNLKKFSQPQVHIGRKERYILFRAFSDARTRNRFI